MPVRRTITGKNPVGLVTFKNLPDQMSGGLSHFTWLHLFDKSTKIFSAALCLAYHLLSIYILKVKVLKYWSSFHVFWDTKFINFFGLVRMGLVWQLLKVARPKVWCEFATKVAHC